MKEELTIVETAGAERDPLLCDAVMPLRATFYPLGFALEIITNSAQVLAAAHERWVRYEKCFDAEPVRLRVGVRGSESEPCPPAPRIHRGWQHLLTTIADAENFSVCDLTRGTGYVWLVPAAANDRAYLRYYFLEGAALSLLNNRYMTPLHAACVQLENRGVLLCGDSGAGKSSLAYACALRGWTYVADDSCCLIRGRAGREVVGNPYQVRFREAGVNLFPELRAHEPVLRGNGDFAIELDTAKVKGIKTALTSTADYVIFLNRREPQPAGLAPFPHDVALNWFAQVVCYGEDALRREQIDALHALSGAKILELRYRDLDWAVDRLAAMVRDGR